MESNKARLNALTHAIGHLYDTGEIYAIYKSLMVADLSGALDWDNAVKELANARPLQYVLGQAHFSDYTFYVDERVLIPRPETDELVHWIINNHKYDNNSKIIDIGTGSGIIPITIKKKIPNATVTAVDISDGALSVAEINAQTLEADVHWIQDDILNPSSKLLSQQYDIIISNPPYITHAERLEMHHNILAHEPHQALFVTNDDPLQFYKAILSLSQATLSAGGHIYLELNASYSMETSILFKEYGFKTLLKKDMQGKSRFLQCKKTS